MTSSKPYLICALFEWIVDNEHTPHILVNTKAPGVDIPEGYDKDGQIVLNISKAATTNLVMDDEKVAFCARFNGRACDVYVPVDAVLGIYSRENGQGMVFDNPTDHAPQSSAPSKPKTGNPPSLKIVK
jgi:stringent starvation protein B